MIKDHIEHIKNSARKNFEDSGSIVPVFISEIDGDKVVMPLFWSGPEDKEAFSIQLQSWIANGSINEYVMVCEAWAVKQQNNEVTSAREWMRENGSLERHPERSEMVMVQYCSPKEEIDCFAEISRNDEGVVLGAWEETRRSVGISVDSLGSRFKGLFAKSTAGLN
jgi:hypothetical protein